MNNITLTDDFGRATVFTGKLLVEDHTDNADGNKPQWLEIGVYVTEAGSYIVQRSTMYRIIHSRESCSRADGYVLVEATDEDTYNCSECNRNGTADDDGFAQAPRITVDVYRSVPELIESFGQNGRYNQLARAILAELSELDEEINAQWNTVHVP